MSEEWRPVFGGLYEVSDLGNVRRAMPGRRTHVGRPMKLLRMKIGYAQVKPTMNGKNVQTYVHDLVAEAFIGPKPMGFTVNHRDGDKFNNRRENLEYVTHAENIKHASRMGLMAHGEEHYRAKLTTASVLALRLRRADGLSFSELAREFGVSISHAFNIVNRRSWGHVQ